MVEKALIEKYSQGLNLRISRIEQLAGSDRSVESSSAESLFDIFEAVRSRQSISKSPSSLREEWYLINSSLSQIDVFDQAHMLETMSDTLVKPFCSVYTIGAALSRLAVTEENISSLQNVDLSNVLESNAFSNPDQVMFGCDSEEIYALYRLSVRRLREHLVLPFVSSFESFSSFFYHLGFVQDCPSGILEFRRCLGTIKKACIHLLGPDLFTFLQTLTDPRMLSTPQQLEIGYELSRVWGMEELSLKFILIRAAGGFEHEMEFLQTLMPEDKQGCPIAEIAGDLLPKLRFSEHNRQQSEEFTLLDDIVVSVIRTSALIPKLGADKLSREVVILFNKDSSIIAFLNWHQIIEVLDREFITITPHTVFITAALSYEKFVRTRFSDLAFMFGDGALVADLDSLVGRLQKPTMDKFLAVFIPLGRSATKFVVDVLLQDRIVERIANSLDHKIDWPADFSVKSTTRTKFLKIDVAMTAGKHSILEAEAVDKIVKSQLQFLRLEQFHNRGGDGRIPVSSEMIQALIGKTIESSLAGVADIRDLSEGGSGRFSEYLPVVKFSKAIALGVMESITEHIDMLLSNNLRHGVIQSRFQRAFIDAYHDVYTPIRAEADWRTALAQVSSSYKNAKVSEFPTQVAKLVREFQDTFVRLEKGSFLYEELIKSIEIETQRILEEVPVERSGEIAVLLAERIEFLLGQVFADIRVRFRKHFDEALDEMASISGFLDTQLDANRTRFADFALINLREAVQDVETWIGITGKLIETVPFSFRDLVNVHLITSYLYDSDKLNVDVKVTNRLSVAEHVVENEVLIRGDYFEFFETVIANLLSNSFANSGIGLRTRIQVRLILSDDRFSIVVRNTLNRRLIESTLEDHSRVVDLTGRADVGAAGSEKSSGFSKINYIGQTTLGHVPDVEVSRESILKGRYQVRVTMPINRNDLVEIS